MSKWKIRNIYYFIKMNDNLWQIFHTHDAVYFIFLFSFFYLKSARLKIFKRLKLCAGAVKIGFIFCTIYFDYAKAMNLKHIYKI